MSEQMHNAPRPIKHNVYAIRTMLNTADAQDKYLFVRLSPEARWIHVLGVYRVGIHTWMRTVHGDIVHNECDEFDIR